MVKVYSTLHAHVYLTSLHASWLTGLLEGGGMVGMALGPGPTTPGAACLALFMISAALGTMVRMASDNSWDTWL